MSKIFEALRKTEGEVADLTLPMVEPGLADDRSMVEQIVRETAAGVPEAIVAAVGIGAERHDTAAQTTVLDPPPQTGPAVRGIRTVSLRLSLDTPVLPFDGAHSRAGEQYRVARTKIIHHPQQPRLIVISSSGPRDGKTVSSVNLAGALALKNEAQVLLIDADLRRASIGSVLGIDNTPGLADVLSGNCALDDAIVRLEQFPNLCVLPGGKAIANPTELLDSANWTALCNTVRRQFKFVIFDAPPIATVADYDLIHAQCDGVILVARPDHTSRKLFMQALDLVPKERLVGVLLNCVRDWFLWKTQDYYYGNVEA
jgi:capsular exopolysaccharide synthesis family protein